MSVSILLKNMYMFSAVARVLILGSRRVSLTTGQAEESSVLRNCIGFANL